MAKYKYANAEGTAVNDTEKGIYGIHPGVYLWAEVEEWVKKGNTIESFETPAEKLNKSLKAAESKMSAEKKAARDRGILVDGILFDTDIEARIAYIEFMLKTIQNPSYSVSNWKASEGVWVTMDAVLFNKLVTALEGRLTSLFNDIKNKEEEIKSKNTSTEVDNVVINFN